MSTLFLSAVSCACVFYLGFYAEACTPAVLAKRGSVLVSEGNTLSLSCTVQLCESSWAGKWTWEKSTDSNCSIVRESQRHHLKEKTPKASEIQLVLEVQRFEPADIGSYRCSVQWADGSTELGHWTYVNITRVVPSQRKVLYRFFVWAGASLCLPVILGLARCLSSEVKPQPQHGMQVIYAKVDKHRPHEPPQPPPGRSLPQTGRPPAFQGEKSKQKTELVYADIYQVAKGTQQVVRGASESTVYSSLRSY
ncbi:hypothetical protein OJAV_G00124930 [Oryzias javanicus]|uniref:Ig-like domain-containing protein n=1 Tax=Oryzias javanicus TaxID=123683 RepID=A0A3S2PE31_ORYJA|nr:hypothetical protein OJAV_G00124930 [Oryzias javanicus]